RILGATREEIDAATNSVSEVLAHPLIERARRAQLQGACLREVPLSALGPDGTVFEGQADLAFRDEQGWAVVDFKTGMELELAADVHRQQLALYVEAIERVTGSNARGVLMIA